MFFNGGFGFNPLRFFDERKDDERLMSLLNLIANESVATLAFVRVQEVRLNGLAAWRHFVEHGEIKIAIDGERERAWDRSGGHHQQVWVRAFIPQRRPLRHAEAMLLIHHRHAQVGKFHRRFDQRMSAHHNFNFARSQPRVNFLFLGGGGGALEKTDGWRLVAGGWRLAASGWPLVLGILSLVLGAWSLVLEI